MGVDLTKGFYFSFTYHLAATLQCNYQAGLAGAYAAAAATATQPGQPGRSGAVDKGRCSGVVRPMAAAAAYRPVYALCAFTQVARQASPHPPSALQTLTACLCGTAS